MKITYKTEPCDFDIMTEDLEITLGLRGFLLFAWDFYMKSDGPSDITKEIEDLIDTLVLSWRKYHQDECTDLDVEGMDKDEIEVDYNNLQVKRDFPFKKNIMYQFILRLEMNRIDNVCKSNKEVVGLYNMLIGEIRDRYQRGLGEIEASPV